MVTYLTDTQIKQFLGGYDLSKPGTAYTGAGYVTWGPGVAPFQDEAQGRASIYGADHPFTLEAARQQPLFGLNLGQAHAYAAATGQASPGEIGSKDYTKELLLYKFVDESNHTEAPTSDERLPGMGSVAGAGGAGGHDTRIAGTTAPIQNPTQGSGAVTILILGGLAVAAILLFRGA